MPRRSSATPVRSASATPVSSPNRFQRRHLDLERRMVEAADGPIDVLSNAAESPLA